MVKLSIIIPSLRQKNLLMCLNSIYKNTKDIIYEVIVIGKNEKIDNIKEFVFNHVMMLRYIEDDKLIGTTYAINLGLNQIQGKYVVTLSDDCLVTSNWASNMISFLESQPIEGVLGNFRVYDKTGELGDIGYGNLPFSLFPIIKTSHIDNIGGYYSTKYNAYYSDPDLGLRAWKYGHGVLTCPNSFIYHEYNPDKIYKSNKEKYFKKDEEIFMNNWGYLFDEEIPICKPIIPNIKELYPYNTKEIELLK